MPAEITAVHGWAWFDDDDLASCSVTINGKVAATAHLEPAAPDVVEQRPETGRTARCSWRARVDLRPHAGQVVEIGAVAASVRGVAQFLSPSRVAVRPAPPAPRLPPRQPVGLDRRGGIEQPAPGALVPTGPLVVSGWALGDGGRPARLAVRVNGRDAGLARPFAAPRADVARAHDDPAAPIAGFERVVRIDEPPGATVQLDVDFVPVGGRPIPLRGVEVQVAAAAGPTHPTLTSDVLAALDAAPRPRGPRARPWRLACFTHSLEIGGGQLYLQELLRDLIKNHDAACLVVTRVDGPLRDELEALGATVHVTEYPMPDTDAYEAQAVELAVLVRAWAAQVVVVNTLIGAIGADVATRVGLPAVWAIHESYTLDDYWAITCGNGRAAACAAANAATLAETAALLFEAEATRAVYADVAGPDRTATLYYGIDIDELDAFAATTDRAAARHALGVAEDRDLLVCVGTFEPRKGQALLATAFSLVAAEFPRATLALIGAVGDGYSRGLRAYVARLGLAERILVRDLEAGPFRWYRAADVVVVPSDVESMPRVLLEAMALAVPVVASDVWGIPELVRPDENGLLCAPRDIEALAETLRAFLRLGPDTRHRLGASGSHVVRARHDLAAYRRVFARLLQRLVDNPDASVSTLLAP
jgi:D-inositol-3-phosphate glycosyltransferase